MRNIGRAMIDLLNLFCPEGWDLVIREDWPNVVDLNIRNSNGLDQESLTALVTELDKLRTIGTAMNVYVVVSPHGTKYRVAQLPLPVPAPPLPNCRCEPLRLRDGIEEQIRRVQQSGRRALQHLCEQIPTVFEDDAPTCIVCKGQMPDSSSLTCAACLQKSINHYSSASASSPRPAPKPLPTFHYRPRTYAKNFKDWEES